MRACICSSVCFMYVFCTCFVGVQVSVCECVCLSVCVYKHLSEYMNDKLIEVIVDDYQRC